MASVKLVYCLSEWEESDPQIRERRARGGTLHPRRQYCSKQSFLSTPASSWVLNVCIFKKIPFKILKGVVIITVFFFSKITKKADPTRKHLLAIMYLSKRNNILATEEQENLKRKTREYIRFLGISGFNLAT